MLSSSIRNHNENHVLERVKRTLRLQKDEQSKSNVIFNCSADNKVIDTNKRKQPIRAAKRMSVLGSEKGTEENKTKKKLPRNTQRQQLEEKIIRKAPSNEYLEGEIVFGIIPGYPKWPARIVKIVHETIYIQFFGTGHV